MLGVRVCRFPYLFQRPSGPVQLRPPRYQEIQGATAGIHAALVASRWPTVQSTVSAYPNPIIPPRSLITAWKHKMWQLEGYSMIDLIRSLRIPDVLFAFVIASAGASSALSAEVA